ncbi:hypothetical protein [Streptomyces olivochromogenes]|uniref:hypothetical protein n=1 Tax=Streptomyces olivochromogenes TaxID=1963 RepID=UPI0036B25A5C
MGSRPGKAAEGVSAERDFVEQPGQALMAVLLVRRMGDRDWIRHASTVVKLHGERKVVSEVLRFFAMSSHLQSDLGREDMTALESLLADIATQRKELPSGPARGQHLTHMLQGLRNRRMRALQQQGRRWIEPV